MGSRHTPGLEGCQRISPASRIQHPIQNIFQLRGLPAQPEANLTPDFSGCPVYG
jgi:hypothetical protein